MRPILGGIKVEEKFWVGNIMHLVLSGQIIATSHDVTLKLRVLCLTDSTAGNL